MEMPPSSSPKRPGILQSILPLDLQDQHIRSQLKRVVESMQLAPTSPQSPAWTWSEVEKELQIGRGIALFTHLTPQQGPEQARDQARELGLDGGAHPSLVQASLAAFLLFRELPDSSEITWLATALDARRQGWMKTLLGRFLRDLHDAKAPTAVWLEVHELNVPAQKLYVDCGFKKVGQRPRYYRDGKAAWLYNYG
jgi:ribosomal protein S18 acetylase RimI-like enzyme